jgi:hypothetical protein
VKRLTLIVLAVVLMVPACGGGSPEADLAEEACTELEGMEFLAANTAMIGYIDRLAELRTDEEMPSGEEAVQDPAALQELTFFSELKERCPTLAETLEAGPTRSELEEIAAGLITAHRELEDFMFQVEGGLTYGDLMAGWPQTSARVSRGLADFNDSVDRLPGGLPADDLIDLVSYALTVATLHDDWAEVHDAVTGYIRDDEPESAISRAFSSVMDSVDRADEAKDVALKPGEG